MKINIVDTPGHADFGGEVERTLNMVQGVLLLVDATEGPLPQTRFVLGKALALGLPPILVINKSTGRTDGLMKSSMKSTICSSILTPRKSSSIFLFSSRTQRRGTLLPVPAGEGQDLVPLFDTILSAIPAPSYDPEAPLKFLVTTLHHSDYVGRIAVGKIVNGELRHGREVMLLKADGTSRKASLSVVYTYEGLNRIEREVAVAGDIAAVAGLGRYFHWGDSRNPANAAVLCRS